MTEPADLASPPVDDTSAADDVNEASLFFGISSERLRRRAKWAGGFLLLSALLPHELVDTSPLFLWDTLPELPIASVLAAVALPVAGLSILLASLLARRATSLAVAILSSFALVAVFYQLGGDRAAWDVFAMPDSISNRPAAALLALALTAAGASLTFRLSTRKLGRGLLVGAVASALFFYAWPSRGEAPMTTLYRAFASLPDLPSFRFQIGMVLLAFIVLWPLVIALTGLVFLRAPARRDNPWLSMVATFGLPSLLLLFAYRALIFAQAGVALLAYVFTILIVTGILALLSSALVVVGEATTLTEGEILSASEDRRETAARSQRGEGARERGRSGLALPLAAAVGGAAFVVLSVAEWILARPPQKGVQWELSGATDQADEVFGPLFANWDNARRRWDSEVRHDASASARLEVKKSAKDLAEHSKALDPKLADAFVALTTESQDLDLAGRRFFRLVEDVNEASRHARLPYYIDPSVTLEETKEGVRRHYYAATFRIDSVNRYRVDGDAFATLIVHPVSGGRTGHGWLGFSRDVQPFALVDIDEIEPYRIDLVTSAEAKVCSSRTFPMPRAEKAADACGAVLSDLVHESGTGLLDALIVGTERHELQHQVDGPHLTLSGPVLERLAAYVPNFQDRVNRELSAYVAELTADGIAPKLELVHLAQFVVGEPTGTYHHAAVMVFEAVSGKELRHGIEPDGRVDYDAFAGVLRDLAAMPDDELRARAHKAYKSLFSTTLIDPKRAD